MDSYAEFYRTAYAPHVSGQRSAGRIGATLTRVFQPAGHFPDTATPDLVLFTQLSKPMKGEVDVGSGRFRRQMPRGNLILCPPNAPGDYVAEAAHELIILSVPYRRLVEMAPTAHLPHDGDFGRLHADQFQDAFLSGAVLRMWDEVLAGHPSGALFADGVVLAIAGALARRAGVATEPVRGGLAPRVLKRVIACMSERLEEDLRIDELASVAELSPRHFSTAFRRSTGLPPHRFLLAKRVERAQRLIGSGVTLTEVAIACGFASQQHLTTAFKKAVGVSPGAWRREVNGLR